jgi:hypothetical protein
MHAIHSGGRWKLGGGGGIGSLHGGIGRMRAEEEWWVDGRVRLRLPHASPRVHVGRGGSVIQGEVWLQFQEVAVVLFD